MNVNDILASKWMAKEDVTRAGVVLTVFRVQKEEIGPDLEEKLTLLFREQGYKPLILNKTNIRILVSLFGAETDAWRDKEVVVYNDPTVGYGGQVTGGVRIRMAPDNSPPEKPTRPAQKKVDQLADDIPF